MKKLVIAALFAITGFTDPAQAAAPACPNIVIIFMDDMGYADVGCFGARNYPTPNIDKLAKAGRRFTNFHVARRCAPPPGRH